MSMTALIAGGGTMGVGIAAVFAAGGWTVQVIEPDEGRATTLPDRCAKCLHQIGKGDTAPILSIVPDLEAVDWSRIDIVVECLPEDLAMKRKFFADTVPRLPADAILVSNSSSFPISAIAEGLDNQDRMAGLHFFMPAHLVPLVEVISGEATAPTTAERLSEMMTALDKRPVLVRRDVPGFLANRIQHALMREAMSLAEHGIASPEDIDAAIRYGFGMRFVGAGPFLQKDLAGLDIHCAAATTIYPDLSNATEPSAFIRDRVAAGDTGVKSGRGFFEWDDDTIAAERERYESALLDTLKILAKSDR